VVDSFRQDDSVLIVNAKLITYAKLVKMSKVSRISTSLKISFKPKALPLNSLFRTLSIFIFITPNSI
jgi:hypothetical protein